MSTASPERVPGAQIHTVVEVRLAEARVEQESVVSGVIVDGIVDECEAQRL